MEKQESPKPRQFSLFGRPGSSMLTVIGLARPGFGDLYHYLVTGSWARVVIAFASAFLFTNAIFGTVYVLVGGVAGAEPGSFVDAFFFSVQTLATIGYGVMSPHSLVAHLVVTVEVMVGMLGLAMSTGLVFSKFSRPKARVVFSNVAAISIRDGQLTFMFRVANQRANHLVEAQLRVAMLRTEKTKEGEGIRRIHDLALVRGNSPAFILTWTAMHPIVPGSPLFGASEQSLRDQSVEILVTLLGIDESISQTIHARHSYSVDDIRWNMRFADLMTPLPGGRRLVDYSRLHDVVPMAETPTEGSEKGAA